MLRFCSPHAVFLADFQRAEKPRPTAVHRPVWSKQKMSAAGLLAPPGSLRWLARLAPASRLEAAVGPGLLRRHPLPSRRVGLCQPRVPWGPRAKLWPQGEKRSGSPHAVRFPELWDLHPGLGSHTCRLLSGCRRPASRLSHGKGLWALPFVRFAVPSPSVVGLWIPKPPDWTRVRATW